MRREGERALVDGLRAGGEEAVAELARLYGQSNPLFCTYLNISYSHTLSLKRQYTGFGRSKCANISPINTNLYCFIRLQFNQDMACRCRSA